MFDNSMLERLREGDAAAIAHVREQIERKTLIQANMQGIWESIIEGIQEGKNAPSLLELGIRFSSVSQDPVIGKMYEDLLSLSAYAQSNMAYVPAISVGAALARISQGEAPEKLDRGSYVAVAKKTLMLAIGKGDEYVRKYAAEGLRHIHDWDVRQHLGRLARESDRPELKEAAAESVSFIRNLDELDGARGDRDFLLETEYVDPTCPQRTYVEMIFSAAETVLSPRKDGNGIEYEAAVKQLATWGADPGEMAGLFDKHNLKVIRRNVENALLHALATHPDGGVREEAAEGLRKIGSDRVEEILERIVERLGEGCPAGALASDTLASIRGGKVEIFEVALPAPKKREPPAQRPRLVQ